MTNRFDAKKVILWGFIAGILFGLGSMVADGIPYDTGYVIGSCISGGFAGVLLAVILNAVRNWFVQ